MDDKPSILEISPLFMLLLSYFAANSQPDCAPSRLPCLAAGARSPIVSLRTLFTDHPATVGETYWQHLGGAWGFSWRLMAASLACLIHALLPFLFVRTGSRAITELHDRMVVSRQRQATAPATRSEEQTSERRVGKEGV